MKGLHKTEDKIPGFGSGPLSTWAHLEKKKKRQQQREQGADGEEGSFTPMAMPPQWRVSGSPTGKDHL